MPHFIIDCSARVLEECSEEQILEQVHAVAHSTGLFDEDDIKVRIHPYQKYLVGGKKEDFIHVFAYIMEGRSTEQKADLSRRVVQKLSSVFPRISKIAMNVYDFEKATYCNREML
jgi:5-carboxymethyl-2-hydroxymuconate isomerase